mgnify:FL=1
MCGIYGITDNNPKFIEDYLEICKHRGPDGSNLYTSDIVTLGHNLLSIMADPGKSQQPWITPKGNRLVYNGEIFNYEELLNKYKKFNNTTGCDTELLAWGLDTHGLDFIDEIDSMHGFAYYDLHNNTITLSRDHAGIKPLYYAEIDKGLVFASEIKGMLDIVPNARILDNLACSMMTKAGTNPLRNTLFTNIKKVLPGETLVYDISKRTINFVKRIYIKPNANNDYDKNELKEMFANAVRQCSIGRRKIGVFLSGGIDSTIVAYELQQIKNDVNTFTNRITPDTVAEEDYNSDSKMAQKFATEQGFKHHDVVISPKEYLSAWEDSIWYQEQPIYNPSNAMYCYTNKYLAENDIVVTLAGDMGDELFGGYPKYLELFRKIKKPTSWRELLSLWMQRIKKGSYALTETLEDDTVLLDELEKCYGDELWNPKDPTASYMALDCVAQVPDCFLARNDNYGMAYSMEGRFPLASKKFMQYCLDIKSKHKFARGSTKSLVKESYKDFLPNYIINKPKTGWTVPIGYWIMDGVDNDLSKVYANTIGADRLKLVGRSQKIGKRLIPEWQIKSWKEKYKIK